MQKYAVITGASSGLGAEFARQLATKGYDLVLVARREERLQELREEIRKTSTQIITADLSDLDECRRVMAEVESLPVSLFVNNAGFGDCGYFLETDAEKEIGMIDLNVRSMHLLAKLMLQKMDKQGYGHVLNVASSAGLIPAGPYMATYYATKAYVASLTRAIAQELKEKKSPLHISALCPGPVDTEFNSVANVRFGLAGITAKQCVFEAIQGVEKQKVVIVPSLRMKLATFGGRFLPQSVYIAMAGHQQKKKL